VTSSADTPARSGARPLDVAAAGSYIGLSELAKSSAAGARRRGETSMAGEPRWD
jgi:hypothetical protein